MKIMMNGTQIGEDVTTNHSMTIEEAVEYALSLTRYDDQEELEKLYDEGCECVCLEDGEYFIDFDSLEMEY